MNGSAALADPTLEVYKVGVAAPIATNDDWSGALVTTAQAQYTGFPLKALSRDAAVVLNLEPGNYTVIVKGKGTATGTALAEVYEVD